MRAPLVGPGLALALLAVAFAVEAQQQCRLFETPTSRATILNAGDPGQMTFIGGGVILRCPGERTIRADSAAHYQMSGIIEFIGHVTYSDSARDLTADYMQYNSRERLVVAQRSAPDRIVTLRDREAGSTIQGPFMSYYIKGPARPEDLIQVPAGRPRATFVQLRDAGDAAMAADTTLIDADGMEIFGESRFIGRGNVVITRGQVRAFGAVADLEESGSRVTLTGRARVEDRDLTLQGDTIVAEIGEGEQFREVVARGRSRLESTDLNVEAPNLFVAFEAGEVDRLVATGDAERRTDRAARARAWSDEFRIEADLLQAEAPARQLERVVAVGAAFGERLTPDSVAVTMPELPEFVRNDWMRGDTIIAIFGAAPATRPDTTGPARVLEELTSFGGEGLASAAYRQSERDDPGSYSISYLIARRIRVLLEGGAVARVEADEQVHGMVLRPETAQARRRDGDAARERSP
jgi:hypothetical protein